ncbi:uncharacterized protein N7529_010649 [Penicillium soppii]|uniref:uncharacterized protein n=1 Tax=Penicillium soppii TaxID=69789 RepID=UPI002547B17A|nr:uncharacterized protein N7529_010649 [Penicillium soppii]KAJ5851264.1 hypothetical protein N7529_010649 [Penicillium soppii]
MLQKQEAVMQLRLERLEQMLGDPLFESILWGHEYDLGGLDNSLRIKIESGQFKRIVFSKACRPVIPLYHVQQFFSIFLDLFHKLKITKFSYQSELEDSVKFLKAEFHEGTLKRAEAIAEKLRGSRIILLRTADWYVTLLKQTTMFFNEIAMVPTHRNLLHEFSHTEVAAYSDPANKQAIVTFCDSNADDYTRNKIQTLEGLFGSKEVPQNCNIEFVKIELNQDDFFKKFFFTHFITIYVAYYLGKYSDVKGRGLISIAAKNPWWSQRSIELFPKCIDIPSVLES